MGVPSRTSAPTPAHDRTFGYSDHPREGAPTFTPPHRGSSTGSDHCSFRADVGSKPDGSRDRRRFTYRTLTEAKREYRRITTEVTIGVYARKSTLTVAEACDEWLAGRRGIRSVTLQGYRHDLAVVKRFLGGRKLQQLTKADGDALVDYMLTSGRRSRRCYQPGSLAGRVIEQISAHPGGISAADLVAAFPNEDVHTCLSGLKRAKRVARPSRGMYVVQDSEAENTSNAGVKPITVRSTLTTFGMVIQSFVVARRYG